MTTVSEDWKDIFDKEQIDVSKDLVLISSDQIRKHGKRDLRLLTYYDTSEDQPTVFQENGYIILPLENRGNYVLVRGKGFETLSYKKPKSFNSRLAHDLRTLSIGTSESQYLDFAYHAGLIEHFLNISGLTPTIRGRKRSPSFSFYVGKVGPINVESVQIEVDGGYEGPKNVALFEVKIGKPKDFNVRQLFYPYRSWKLWMQDPNRPPVDFTTVFFAYDSKTQTYYLWEYRFDDDNQYNSIRLVKQGAYHITSPKSKKYSLKNIATLSKKSSVTSEWMIPQANDMTKVASFPFKVAAGHDDSEKIAKEFEFHTRQSSYYRHAAESLGLIILVRKGMTETYCLTPLGKKYVTMNAAQRNALLCSLLLKLPVLDAVLNKLFEKKKLTLKQVADIIENETKYNAVTSKRRASTLLAWFKWMEHSLGIVKVTRTTVELP